MIPVRKSSGYAPPTFQQRYHKSHAWKPGPSTPGSRSGPAGVSAEQGAKREKTLSCLSSPGTGGDARGSSPLTQMPHTAASRPSPAHSSASHLNSSTCCCCYSKRSPGLGVLALLFPHCESWASSAPSWASVCSSVKWQDKPIPCLFHATVGGKSKREEANLLHKLLSFLLLTHHFYEPLPKRSDSLKNDTCTQQT